MSYDILNRIDSPTDLKALSEEDVQTLCAELREFMIDKVEKQGGHLASNLGVTELTVALHRIFDSPRDHIIFDVGHQSYVHKILTGRRERFDELRVPGGLSGFTRMSESEHDPFGAGHSSTSVSAALGYAEADAMTGSDAYTVCVMGDGAYTGGMIHEALNNCKPDLRLVIVLNENGMSISSNKGTFANYLSKVRTSKGYNELKRSTTSFLHRIPLVGKAVKAVLSAMKNAIKSLFLHPNYFEELGLYYIGPVDGNDYKKISEALKRAKSTGKCVVVHAKTVKGKGYTPAEASPQKFHSVTSSGAADDTFHARLVEKLLENAKNGKKIVAVTAAMGAGTGFERFGELYPERYFDVGIAESHAITFSAGLAANGMRPYVAIYSTFLQRGYDNVVHDVALQGLPVCMIIDRAGLAHSDGATHHGIFDVSFLSHIPSVELYAPASYSALQKAIRVCETASLPVAIRYPNGAELDFVDKTFYSVDDTDTPSVRVDFPLSETKEVILVTYGGILSEVVKAKELLLAEGLSAGIVLVEKIKPYADAVDLLATLGDSCERIVYVEEGIKNGGAAMITQAMLKERGCNARFDIIAIDDNFAAPSLVCDLYDYTGLSAKKIAERIKYNA